MTVDYSRRGKRSKRKGDRGELEIRDLLRDRGYDRAHRSFMSGGAGGGDLADAIPDVHLEVKRTEVLHLPAAWKQARRAARPSDTVLIVHRGNGQPWQSSLLLRDLISLEQALMFSPRVIGRRDSVRAEFLAWAKMTTWPMIAHQLGRDAMATVLFADWLEAFQWRAG